MADSDNKLQEYLNTITENIAKLNSNSKISKNTTENTLYDLYEEINNDITELKSYYTRITSLELSATATFCLVVIDMIYMADFNRLATTYKSTSEFIYQLLSEKSTISLLIDSIESHYKILSSTSDQITKDSEINIIKQLLYQLYELLQALLINFGIVPKDFTITENNQDNAPFNYDITSSMASSISFEDSTATENLWHGSVNRSGWVAQEAEVFISQVTNSASSENEPIIVSVPIAKINNSKYQYNSESALSFLNLINYINKSYAENDGSNVDNSSVNLIEKYSYIRCGTIFSGSSGIQTTDMPFKIMYDSNDGTYAEGNINYFGQLINDKINIKFNYSSDSDNISSATYPNTKLSDSIQVTRTFTYKGTSGDTAETEYSLTGELQYNETESNTKNNEIAENLKLVENDPTMIKLNDTRPVSVYTGTLTLTNLSIDYDSLSAEEQAAIDSSSSQMGRNVVVEIRYNDSEDSYTDLNDPSYAMQKGTYDIICYINPESTTSAITVINNVDNILPNFVTQFTYNNTQKNNNVSFTSSSDLVAQALLILSQLDPSDNNFDMYFGILWNTVSTMKNSLIQELLSIIDQMNSTVTILNLIHTEYGTSVGSFDNDTVQEFTTELNTFAQNFSTYLSSDSYDVEELYDGTLYNKIVECENSTKKSLENILTESADIRDKLEDLENKLFLFVDTEKKGWSVNSIINSFYQLLSATTTTAETMASTGTPYNTYSLQSYNEWSNNLLTNFQNISGLADTERFDSSIPNNYKYYFYVYDIGKTLLSKITNDDNDYYKLLDESKYKYLMRYSLLYSTTGLSDDNITILNNYKSLPFSYTGNDNNSYVNPELMQNFSGTSIFDYVELEESLTLTNFVTNSYTLSGIVYAGFLNNKYSDMDTIISDKIKFINTYKPTNIREALFIYYMLQMFEYIYQNNILDIYEINGNSPVADLLNTYKNYIIYYLQYKEAYKNKSFISLLFR